MRRAGLRLLAVGAGVVGALLVGEVALRLVDLLKANKTPRPAATAPAKLTDWDLPDFRGEPPAIDKAEGTFRILLLGDSFSWGFGVEPGEAYPARLERRLESTASGRRFEVFNWSRPGWNTWEQWTTVRTHLTDLDPDLLLLGYVLNDAEPTSERERRRLRRLADPPPPGPLITALEERSLLIARSRAAFDNFGARERLARHYSDLYELPGWEESRHALRRLRIAAKEMGIPFLVVLFPIFDSEFDERYAYAEIHDLVTRAGKRLKIQVFDLLPTFRETDGRAMSLVPFSDAHPSVSAHDVAARAIHDELLRRRLLELEPAPPDDDLLRPRSENG